jgi:hypothetical protein
MEGPQCEICQEYPSAAEAATEDSRYVDAARFKPSAFSTQPNLLAKYKEVGQRIYAVPDLPGGGTASGREGSNEILGIAVKGGEETSVARAFARLQNSALPLEMWLRHSSRLMWRRVNQTHRK